MSPSYPKNEPLAVTSLVLACIGLVAGPFTSIPAIVCGHLAASRIRREPDLVGAGLARAGLVVGYFVTLVSVLAIAAYLLPRMTHP